MNRHFFYSQDETPFRDILIHIKKSQGKTIQREIEDAFLLLHYPHLLHFSHRSPELIIRQAELSIHRLTQEITQLTALITSLSPPSQTFSDPETETEITDESQPLFSSPLFTSDSF
ncbi:hypothetical protein [Picosynechococcus sp. NKBG042902]|uniref:hypothetical protein n=1 Tax=Picosynechococcus sp. NKBG042902 TaxID=490193 RepID=UPI0004ABAD10|nr:hypothetical protein [Picosynechococcus sp. NKBG042902]